MKTSQWIVTVIILLFCALASQPIQAQDYKRVGNELIKVDSSTKNELIKVDSVTKAESILTELTVTINDVEYPVYQGTRGGYYIIRVSKKSGKKYKQYFKIDRI